jgi:hypothetical protein
MPLTKHLDSILPEQRIYARGLAVGSRLSFALLVATFVIYLTGVVPALVPVAELPKYWGLSAAQYVAATGTPTGWRWLAFIGRSDVMNLVGIACVALVTPVCFARLVVEYVRQRESTYTAIALMELWILMLAASGMAAG